MGFLSKLFGKKKKDDIEEAELLEEATDDGLTPEEEEAAATAEEEFYRNAPEIAEEDIVAEEYRLEMEQREREEADEEAARLRAEEQAAINDEAADDSLPSEEETTAEEATDGGLTPEEEEAAATAEAEFYRNAPEIAEEDIVAEGYRLEMEQREREEAAEEAARLRAEEQAAANDETAEGDGMPEASEEVPVVEETATRQSFWGRLKSGLTKTRNAIFAPVDNLLKNFVRVDEDLLEELEEILISADVGMTATEEILDQLRVRIKDGRLKEKEQVMTALREIITDMIGESQPLCLDTKPSVLMVIGVNGAGKTTSIGKISKRLRLQGKKVVVAAADTFRAAAIDQLAVWCERAGVEMVHQNEGSDPAAVVFDAIAVAKKRGADVLIIDTAGRLQNKKNLMNELAKIDRVVDRELPGAARETLLVLDATTGQNAVSQAKEFSNAARITGITLNKLDGTAKGGIIISIKEELNIPVKFIGVGEKIDDMQEFDAADFIKALFED